MNGNLSLMACFADVNVSQTSVTTGGRCGGIFNIHLTANLPRNPAVNFFNQLRFDRIMVMSLWPHFFGPPCTCIMYNNANTKQCDCIVRREARIIDWSLENSGGNSNVIELGFIECIHLRWCHGPPATTTTDQNFSASAAEKINVKKGKVFPYSLPSVGPGADPGVQAVSPQVT